MHRDLPSSRQMKTTRAWQYWIIQYFSFFTAAREKKIVQFVMTFQVTSSGSDLGFQKVYWVKNFPVSLLFSEHGQKLGFSKSSYPKQGTCMAMGHGKQATCTRGECSYERWERHQVCGYIAVLLLQFCRKIPSPAWAMVFRVQYMGGFFMFLNGRSWCIAVINTINCQEI